MAVVEYWTVASKYSPIVFIIKGKRSAVSLARSMNRINRLTYQNEFCFAEKIEKYFDTHKTLKRNLRFCGFYSYLEKDKILKIIFNPRGINE